MSPVKRLTAARSRSVRVLCLTIGARRIDWGVVPSGARNAAYESLGSVEFGNPDAPASRQDMISALAQLPEKWASGDRTEGLEVLIADRWLAETVLPWTSALTSNECEVYVREQLTQAGYDVSSNDVVRLDDAAFGRPRLAVAYPADLLAALTRGAGHWGVRLVSVLPVSVAAWTLARDRLQHTPQALVLLDEDDLVLLVGGQPNTLGRPSSHVEDVYLRPRRADLAPSDDLRETWQRICLRQPQWEKLDRVALLTGYDDAGEAAGFPHSLIVPDAEAGSTATDSKAAPVTRLLAMKGKHRERLALDALPPSQSIGLRSGALLVAAMVVVLFLGLRISQTAEAVTAVELEVDAAARPAPIPTAVPSWTREEASHVRAVNAAIRELNLPVSALLSSIAPPRDIRIAVLSVETSGEATKSRSGLRIVAQTPSSTEMARYVGFVAERKPFVGAYLVRHESVEEAGQRYIRFTVEAQWND